MKRKIISIITITILVLGLLTGCSDSDPEIIPADAVNTPADATVDATGDSLHFETADLNGEKVTDDIFSDYDITMINIWATWCYYCIEEMPGLVKLYDELPANVNMITICDDAADSPSEAAELVSEYKMPFKVLEMNESLNNQLSEILLGFPTTVFVDKDGNIVGEVMTGAPRANNETEIAEAYMSLIQDALLQVQ